MKLKKGTRLSPHLEKCCLLLVANESFANAQTDIETLMGIKIPHSTQHRVVNNYDLPEPKITKRAESLSVDGGTIRLRTALGEKSEWKNYKAIKIHERAGIAFFQNYLRKHRSRIPDYQLYQSLGICIGSGSVESWIKQIASRVKIIGAQWSSENVPQILKLRCVTRS